MLSMVCLSLDSSIRYRSLVLAPEPHVLLFRRPKNYAQPPVPQQVRPMGRMMKDVKKKWLSSLSVSHVAMFAVLAFSLWPPHILQLPLLLSLEYTSLPSYCFEGLSLSVIISRPSRIYYWSFGHQCWSDVFFLVRRISYLVRWASWRETIRNALESSGGDRREINSRTRLSAFCLWISRTLPRHH